MLGFARVGGNIRRCLSSGYQRGSRAWITTSSSPPPASCTRLMTKIICTLGPATEDQTMVNALVREGMACARLNFSHVGDYSEPLAKIKAVRAAPGLHHTLLDGTSITAHKSPSCNVRAILVDTKGPEIRTGPLPGNALELAIEKGEEVILTNDDVVDVTEGPLHLHVDYLSLHTTVSTGGTVLLDDGLISLEVIRIDPSTHNVHCIASNGGPIKARKGVNLPGAVLDLPALTDKDKEDLRWAVENGADYVAASFIRCSANVRSCIAYLERCCDAVYKKTGVRPFRPLVISKIESEEGVNNFDDILSVSDGIMVARGDLGVEIPFSAVFLAQKMMVKKCNKVGKPVIVATQMLDSMMRFPRPTRAEVTDVGTAVFDGADAVMLSGETAAGNYPLEAIHAMADIVKEADREADKDIHDLIGGYKYEPSPSLEAREVELHAVAQSAVEAAFSLNAKLIIVITESGSVARAVARYRPNVPVLAFCSDPRVARQLQLHRGIFPVLLQNGTGDGCSLEANEGMGVLRTETVRTAKELGLLSKGERVVTIDRSAGKVTDLKLYGTNLKVFTVL